MRGCRDCPQEVSYPTEQLIVSPKSCKFCLFDSGMFFLSEIHLSSAVFQTSGLREHFLQLLHCISYIFTSHYRMTHQTLHVFVVIHQSTANCGETAGSGGQVYETMLLNVLH